MKRPFILISIILLFLILPSCKTAEESSPEIPFDSKTVGIWTLSGRGTYDSIKDESTLWISVNLRSPLPTAVNNIINWRIKLFVEGELFIEINQDNYKTLLGDNAYVEIKQPFDLASYNNTALGHVNIRANDSDGKPIAGDFYNGKNPNSFEAIITIQSSTGYVYKLSVNSTNYTFSRS